MKTKILLLFIFTTLSGVSQTYEIDAYDGQTITTCSGVFTDSDPSTTGNYGNNEDYTVTFCSGNSSFLTFDFDNGASAHYDPLAAGDTLYMYDGNTGDLIMKIDGSDDPSFSEFMLSTTSTCVTFRFISNGSGNDDGWAANITCTSPPANCNGNPAAADILLQAPFICNFNGYCGNTSTYYHEDLPYNMIGTGGNCPSSQAFLGTVQNNSWLAFVATAASVTLNFSVPACTDGIQVAIMQYDGSDWVRYSDCNTSDGGNSGNFALTGTGMTIGEVYYLMMDGNMGADCDYTISASTGVAIVSAGADQTICPGNAATLTATGPPGAIYTWTAIGGGYGPVTGTSVSVSPGATTDYVVEVTGDGICESQTDTVSVIIDPGCAPVCSATLAPTATDACQGDTVALLSGISGIQGGNPGFQWSASNPTLNTYLINATSSIAGIEIPDPFSAGTFTVSVTYTDDNGCNLTQIASFDVLASSDPACFSCNASVGIVTVDVDGQTQTGTTVHLSDGSTVNIAVSGGTLPPDDSAPGDAVYGYFVFNQAPNIPFSDVSNIPSEPGFIGVVSGTSISDDNMGGFSSSSASDNHLWFVPATFDVGGNNGEPLYLDNNGDSCYDYGSVIDVIYDLNTACGTCVTPDCSIAGPFADYSDAEFPANHCSQMNLVSGSVTNTTYVSYHALTASSDGSVGLIVSVGTTSGGSCTVIRTAALFSGSPCTTAISPGSTTANGSPYYNPEWYGLTPGASYILEITYTVPSGCTLDDHCESFYYPPAANCGTCSSPDCGIAQVPTYADRTDGYDGGSVAACNYLSSPITNTTYVTYHTVTADQYGGLGVVQQVGSSPSGCVSRSAVLYSNGGTCNSPITASIANANGVSSGFNPEWTGLTPNATYVLEITTTIANGCQYDQGCAVFYGLPVICNLTATATEIQSVTCNGGDDGTATVSVSNGAAPFSYAWSTTATTDTITDRAAGSYTVTVTDNNGCTATAGVTVSEPLVLSLSLTSTDEICSTDNGTATAQSSGGVTPYVYTWSNFATTASLVNIDAGSYTVTVTDANACTSTGSSTVNNQAFSFSVNGSGMLNCNNSADGTASVTISAGLSPFDYVWSDGSTSASLTNLSVGYYTVTVTDANSCSDTGGVLIQVPSELILTAAVTDVACAGGNSGAISITATGGTTNYSYSWSDGSTTAARSGLNSGSYSVTVTDANGCAIDSSFIIGEPSALVINLTTVPNTCTGGMQGVVFATVAGGVSPHSYQWNNGTTSSTATGLVAGNYSVTVTDSNGCQIIGDTVLVDPVPVSVTLSTTNPGCSGNDGAVSATVTGGAQPYGYAWSSGQSVAAITNLSGGSYSCTVTDAAGCTSAATATLTAPGIPDASITSPSVFCTGSVSTNLTSAQSGGTWSGTGILNGTTAEFDLSVPGSYSVTYTITQTCTSVDSITVIVYPNPSGIQSVNPPSCKGNSDGNITIDNLAQGTSVNWVSGESGSVLSNLSAGLYIYTLQSPDGCINQDTAVVPESDVKCGDVYIPNIFSPNGDQQNDIFYVRGHGITEFELIIFNRWGEVVFESKDQSFGWDGTQGGKKLNPDVFVYLFRGIANEEAIERQGNVALVK